MDKLDLLDRKIMYELDINARLSASQLAKKLRRSKETVNFRINRLIEHGFLKGSYTMFNTSQLGYYYTKVYVKFRSIKPEKEKEIMNYLSKQDHVSYLASLEGHYDCIFLVMVRSSEEMVAFMDPFMGLYGQHIQEKEIAIFLITHRLNQRFLFEGKEMKDRYHPLSIGNYEVDDVDKKIMNVLSTDARIPLVDIAKEVGVDAKLVKYRLKRLERDGIILGYVTTPNFSKLGFQFFQLNISLKDPTVRRSMISYFSATNKCLFAIELLGKYDLTIELHVESSKELRDILDGFRRKFVDRYNDYDVSTITKEYLMVWSPFAVQKPLNKNI